MTVWIVQAVSYGGDCDHHTLAGVYSTEARATIRTAEVTALTHTHKLLKYSYRAFEDVEVTAVELDADAPL